jgi:hypothetical protein
VLLASEAGAELQKSARELYALSKGEEVASATRSLTAVKELTEQVSSFVRAAALLACAQTKSM